jgi:hypothetical protein
MKRFTGIAVVAVLVGGFLLGPAVLADGEDSGWTIEGVGTTSVEKDDACNILLKYDYDVPSFESEKTWVMTRTAGATGTFEVSWKLNGFHGWFLDWVELYVFADDEEGTTTQTLVATPHQEFVSGETDGPFTFSGTFTVDLTEGEEWGFIVKGANFDSGGALRGTLTLYDTTAPTLAPVATPFALWPPDHDMREVVVQANVDDDCCDAPALSVEISSNEPVNGDDGTSPDWEVLSIDDETGEITLNLRAERDINGEGRIYTIEVTATDAAGNEATESVEVIVPLPPNNGYGPYDRPVFLVISLPGEDDPGTFEEEGKTYFLNIGKFIAGQEIPNTRFEILDILDDIELPDGLVFEDLDGSEFTILGSFNTFSESSIHLMSPSGAPIPRFVQDAFYAASPFFDSIPGFPAPTVEQVAQFIFETAVGFGMPVTYQQILQYIFIPGEEPLVCSNCEAEGELFPHDDPTEALFGYQFVVDEDTGGIDVAVSYKVEIDLKPDDDENVVNYKSKGKVWCAILWTDGFDPLEEVVIDSVLLGAAGPVQSKEEDVNDDGHDDLVLKFERTEIGLTKDTEVVTLTGETYAGGLIEGEDMVVADPGDGKKK